MKKQKGITLIALVITIIVLLILAGVSISMALGENGILTRAENAVDKHEEAERNELAELQKAEDYMDKYIKGGTTSAGKEVADLINSSGTKIGIKVSDGANGEVPVPEEFYYVGGTISSGVVISDNVNDQNKYKGETDVGIDLEGNQFVWVPCTTTGETGKVAYAQDKQYNDGTTATKQANYTAYTDWEEKADIISNAASIEKYGGFYIGRYEAGVPNNAEFYVDSPNDTYYTTSKNVATYTPVSKAKSQSWNYISQINAKIVSSAMYESSRSITSALIDSYAWDTTVNWIKDSGKDILDSRSYGNHRDSSFLVNNTLYAKHIQRLIKSTGTHSEWFPDSIYRLGTITLGGYDTTEPTELPDGYDTSTYTYKVYKEIATGSSETAKVKNIYDMAGNMWEWTTEEGYHDAGIGEVQYAVLRSGSYDADGSAYPIVSRRGNGYIELEGISIGFRVVLYIK